MHFRKLSQNELIAWGCTLGGAFVAVTVAKVVNAEGLKIGNPFFSRRVFGLDTAQIAAIFLVLIAGFAADGLTKMSLSNGHPYGKFVPIAMGLFVFADTVLFYMGCAGLNPWAKPGIDWQSAIVTTAYASAIFVFSYANIYFWNHARRPS